MAHAVDGSSGSGEMRERRGVRRQLEGGCAKNSGRGKPSGGPLRDVEGREESTNRLREEEQALTRYQRRSGGEERELGAHKPAGVDVNLVHAHFGRRADVTWEVEQLLEAQEVAPAQAAEQSVDTRRCCQLRTLV